MSDFSPLQNAYDAKRRLGFGILAVLVASACAVGCRPPAAKERKIPEVEVKTAVADDVTDYQDFTGRMDALKTVDIRPRVSGYITEAPFKEGDLVKEGDVLFQIDPRTYKADLDQAEANLKQAKAEVSLQNKRAERGYRLMHSGSGAIGPEDYDQLIALRDKAIATVGSMEAARDRAKLYLDFTRVTVPPLRDDEGKPLHGRISRRQVDPGNLVNADQTILTTLVSVDRMYAYFDVDERTYLELAAITSPGNSPGAESWFSALSFPVRMRLANEDEFNQKGHVNFLDNRLNANTGTVRMRGVFDNPQGVLKSGLFVRIRLPKGEPHKRLLIPDEAVQSDQGGKNVLVVRKGEKKQDGTRPDIVKYLPVKLGESIGELRAIVRMKKGADGILREIQDDDPTDENQLKSDDRVIVSGMQRVRPNMEVVAKDGEKLKVPSSLTKMLSDERPAVDALKQTPPAPTLKEMQRVGAGEGRHEGKEKGRH